jgi:hypothetical protein
LVDYYILVSRFDALSLSYTTTDPHCDEKIIHQYRKTNKNTWPINKERDKQELK